MVETPLTTATRLAPDRLRAGGPRNADAYVWAGRVAVGGAALAAIWLAFAALRPLPTPDAEPGVEFPAPPRLPETGAQLAERERLVAALSSANYFSPDRAMWKPHEPKASAADATASGAAAETPPPLVAPAPERPLERAANPFDRIPLTDPKTSRIAAKIKEVELRGVYSFGGDPAALISLTTDPRRRAVSVRTGDAFGDGEWKLLAVDEHRDRVIVSRGGENFMLSLYPETVASAGAARPPVPAAEPPHAAGPRVTVRTPEQVRAELEKAGVPTEEIDALLAAAQSDPGAAPSQPESPAAIAQSPAGTGATPPASGDPEAASPAGLRSILKVMSANPLTGAQGGGIDPPRRSKKKNSASGDTGGAPG